jgi:hypothetical protein
MGQKPVIHVQKGTMQTRDRAAERDWIHSLNTSIRKRMITGGPWKVSIHPMPARRLWFVEPLQLARAPHPWIEGHAV